ncbi:cellulose binding domain-containing protein [Actinoplanes sp. NPDC049599]|uniref:cellulose binding domain-containing protein n=1 Tax=Actinoplanes sp. NPDC049599 TaxID=3363903 RepID=UPI0037989A6A
MKTSRRRLALLAGPALVVLAGGFGIATAEAATAPACRVTYTVTSQWNTGFGADVTVTNLGDPVNGWTLGWTLAAGQGITQAWNATVTVAGSAVTATAASYNSSVPAGGSVSFGFTGSHTGANPVPATFVFNGTTCTGPAATTSPPAPSPTPCTGPSTPPVTPSPTAAPPKVKVWMAGDSTMMNAAACPIGWGSQFAGYLTTDVTVQNSAVGGRSVQTWLYEGNVTGTRNSAGECVVSPATYHARWTAMLDATTGMRAGDYLVIQFGINDGDSACPRHVGAARYQELLGVMAQAAKARGAKPILVTPVAAVTCSGSTAVGNRGFLTETRNAATANGVPVIDLHQRSLALYNSLKLCPNNGDYTAGAVGAFFCNDHTHFEAAGARQIAGLVATALREQGIGLAAYLR